MSDWLEALSGQKVGPAAGAAACMTGAMGVALLMKLHQLSNQKRAGDPDRTLDSLRAARQELRGLARADEVAVVALMKQSDQERMRMSSNGRVPEFLSVPVRAAHVCQAALLVGQKVVDGAVGHAAWLDGMAGLELLRVSRRVLRLLVRANIGHLKDGELRELVRVPVDAV